MSRPHQPHKPHVKRVYDDASPDDGVRVLVDRVWPRGLTKERAQLDEWCKAVAPSTELRSWYSHDPKRFDEFVRRYQVELKDPERAEAFAHLKSIAAQSRRLTLLTATKDVELSQAAVLAELLS
jgi:uncharacterized protein YeaO (DUF488 family)